MKPRALLTTIPSDSHSWNLVFMEMFLAEHGFEVENLGICAPYELTYAAVRAEPRDLVVVSTVNGHGHLEGPALARHLTETTDPGRPRLVIGGKLGTEVAALERQAAELRAAGYDAVFYGPAALADFVEFLAREPAWSGAALLA
ncbi:MAG TPA: cobalamin-dependent protein [Thermoanaerobaculia bacterium]|nr:cobalamin-dependent protein [Thermoanaerobaculia bacterium]